MKREIEQNDIEKTQAKAIVALLDQDLASIDPLTLSKLKYGREKALSKMSANEVITHRGVLHLLGAHVHHQKRWIAVLGLLLLLSLLFIMRENAQDIGQSDAYLLSSELPPEAYLNEGFDEWLSENSQP
jgi:hypothetical protein